MSAKVYFSRTITPEKVLELYRLAGRELTGKVAVKVHSGEKGNQNFLTHDFWKPMIDAVGGTVVECNTAYEGQRNVTSKHVKLMHDHGWTKYFDVDILDRHFRQTVEQDSTSYVLCCNVLDENVAESRSFFCYGRNLLFCRVVVTVAFTRSISAIEQVENQSFVRDVDHVDVVDMDVFYYTTTSAGTLETQADISSQECTVVYVDVLYTT